jgi:general secretion pathway protein C
VPTPFLNNLLQQLSRRKSPLWRYTTILVVSFFVAKSFNLLVAYYYLPVKLPEPSKLARGRDLSPALPSSGTSIPSILSRNIFDSDANKKITERKVSAGDQIFPSTLSVELLGTIVFENTGFSVALIQERSKKTSDYYGIGDNLLSARIVKIERFKVIIENNDRLERLEVKAAQDTLKRFSDLNKKEAPQQKKFQSELEEIGPNHYVIPQTIIDDTLKNFSKILTQARMVPNISSSNKTDGFRVFQIKAGSIYEKIGLKNNDIIKRVNGQYLDSFEKATGLFSALRNENSLSIDIERDGIKVNYKYEIR